MLTDEALLSVYIGYLRRDFSFHAVRSQSRLLLDRLELLGGEGTTEVARRRQAAAFAELSASRQRSAVATALKQSRAVVRWGRFMVD